MMNDQLYWLLQFRSDTDEREEYVIVTSVVRDEWKTLALNGFKFTTAARIVEVAGADIQLFEQEHRYWLREEWNRNPYVPHPREDQR